jgi:hypothetical protein
MMMLIVRLLLAQVIGCGAGKLKGKLTEIERSYRRAAHRLFAFVRRRDDRPTPDRKGAITVLEILTGDSLLDR